MRSGLPACSLACPLALHAELHHGIAGQWGGLQFAFFDCEINKKKIKVSVSSFSYLQKEMEIWLEIEKLLIVEFFYSFYFSF